MGEAKRKSSHSPTAYERVRRLLNRLWLAYPAPIRTFYGANSQIGGGFGLVVLALVIVGLVAQWLLHR